MLFAIEAQLEGSITQGRLECIPAFFNQFFAALVCFVRERTQEAWAAFSQIEAELRQIIDTDETHQRGEELVEKCGSEASLD